MFNFLYKKSDLNDFFTTLSGALISWKMVKLVIIREVVYCGQVKPCEYVRENANVKGAPNLTSGSFACG